VRKLAYGEGIIAPLATGQIRFTAGTGRFSSVVVGFAAASRASSLRSPFDVLKLFTLHGLPGGACAARWNDQAHHRT